MRWNEISITTQHPCDEPIAAILTDEFGATGTVIDDPAVVNAYIDANVWDYTSLKKSADKRVTITAYFPQDETKETVARLLPRLRAVADEFATEFTLSYREIDDEDWSESWKKYFHVTRINEKIVIKPTWEEYAAQAGEIVLAVDPGAAFGTGTHPSTALCLEALSRLDLQDELVFDVGTGSGILAAAAAKLGAAQVIAIDNDETAVLAARENARQNKIDAKVSARVGNLLAGENGRADVIVANIVADVILALLPSIPPHLKPHGAFIAGGIIEGREDEIRTAAEKLGLKNTATEARKEWRAMIFAAEEQ